MKKIILVLAAIFSIGVFSASADNDKVINKNQLPAQAQQFINEHFNGVDLSYAKQERDILKKSYEVRLANGVKIEFNEKGVWEEVDCQFGEVPAAVIPVAIKKYVDDNFAGEKVISIERNRYNYEVKLSNRLELKFDKDFNIYDIDD
ncbi:MAG: PepSY-like domain-containing protein [Bacteroidaceae bacterium]|jgi:hypothetical protein|nr:PepSY-like domain-containing protein [Bacteroidaceae bacterium]